MISYLILWSAVILKFLSFLFCIPVVHTPFLEFQFMPVNSFFLNSLFTFFEWKRLPEIKKHGHVFWIFTCLKFLFLLLYFIDNIIVREFSIENNFLQYVEDISPLSSELLNKDSNTNWHFLGRAGRGTFCVHHDPCFEV